MVECNNIAAVVWDFDGVINDNTLTDGFLWHQNLERDFGISISDIQEHLFLDDWQDIILGKLSLLDKLQNVLPLLGVRGSASEFLDYWFEQDLNIDQDLIAIVRKLASDGVPSYLGTNQEPMRGQHLREQSVLIDNFDDIFVSGDLGVAKPDANFFHRIRSAIGHPQPAEMVLIDDSAANIETARKLGWQAIYYQSRSDLDGVFT